MPLLLRNIAPAAPVLAALVLAAFPRLPAAAISPDNAPSGDNSTQAELASFTVHDDFRVDLYADESLGIANPIAIQWDTRGRLWVLCTLAYAQLKPGELADDKLFILEDRDGDGRADNSIVFADGLEMPTGFALGHGGVYLGEGPDLVFLEDTDGDDRADRRELLLTGFGTGDTHQNISGFVFDSGGFLYFSQGLHTYSQVETPWGVSRGDTAGFWRYDPRLVRLDPFGFPSMTSQNPWGTALDRWGALFVKSNGPHLCFATPALVPTTHSRELMIYGAVGQTPGKSMGVEVVESDHLPGWIQDHAIISGYFAREVSAIPLAPEGSGFANSPPVQLVYGGHESFRPVDTQQGPDGAIYVADWFNPIINHYQVSLRHPDRDYTHGRIWRISAKDRPPATPPDLKSMSPRDLFTHLSSGEPWTRETARRLLADHADPDALAPVLENRVLALDPRDPADALALVEGAGILESHGAVNENLLEHLQSSVDPYARAAVARILGRAMPEIPGTGARLAALLRDPHPRPRLEAVVACANRPVPGSLQLALTALDSETDRFLDYALKQAVFALEDQWKRDFDEAGPPFASPEHLAFALEVYGGETSARMARAALDRDDLPESAAARLLEVLAAVGNPGDLEKVFDHAHRHRSASLLEALATAKAKPASPDESALRDLLDSESPTLRNAAIRLAGLWRTTALADIIERIALDSKARGADRTAALGSLAALRGKSATASLQKVARAPGTAGAIRQAAIDGLVRADIAVAAETIAALIVNPENEAGVAALLTKILGRGEGPAALAKAFEAGGLPDERVAREILTALILKGRTDSRLTPMLNDIVGIGTAAPDYDLARVQSVAAAVRSGRGDAVKGREVYELPQLACVGCHRIGDAGGVIGPRLTNVGAGLPLDQIVESILWPGRQIKEGYQALSLTKTDGRVITGYLERESEDIIWYRNTTTPWILPLSRNEIATREAVPTLMPAGLTASLTEEQFLDLVAYLASLKGIPNTVESPN